MPCPALQAFIFCVCGGIIKNEEKGENESEEKKRKKEEIRGKEGKERELPQFIPTSKLVP
jgi:hypothetical protein